MIGFLGVMVKSGEVFPANFPDKGPEQPLRLARLFTGLQPVRMLEYIHANYFCCDVVILCFLLGVRCVRL